MLKTAKPSRLAEELFCQELAFLLKGGVSLADALDILKSPAAARIRGGLSLDESLTNFSQTTRNIIAIGERSGTLTDSLLQAASYLNKQASLKRKLITALIYPLLTILVTLLVGGGIMFYVFPKILPVIESLNIPLPWTTRTLIAIHHFLDHYSFILIGILIALAIIGRASYKYSKKFSYHVDKFILFTPLFGKLFKNYELATITRHLGLLIKNGETLSEAWVITTKNISNAYLKTIAENFNESLKAGQTLSSLWQKYPRIFPTVITQFISVSERSGCLDKSLIEVADRLEGNVDYITKTMSSLIEPLLMTIIGLSIGFLALAILSPIYEITAHLNH